MRQTVAAGLLAAALLATACSDDDGDAAPTGDRVDLEADGPAAVELLDFDDEVVRISDYAGTPVVVNVFASWCEPCVREMPAIERVKQAVGDEDVAFLGIATNDRPEDALQRVEETGVTWDLARDPQGEAAAELGVVRMPTTFLVDADGEVVATNAGEIEEDELLDLLEEHFGVTP